MKKLITIVGISFCSAILCAFSPTLLALDENEQDFTLKRLGKQVFFDDTLANGARQSCASCHDPRSGWTEPRSRVNESQVVARGANPQRFGNIKPPTNAYSSFVAPFDLCQQTNGGIEPCGGLFWNGRAEGRNDSIGGAIFPGTASKHIDEEVFQGISNLEILAYRRYFGPVADQALNPIPNPNEQNLDRQTACQRVEQNRYSELYTLAWGEPINCSDDIAAVSAQDVFIPEKEFDISFKRLMLAVSAYQHSREVNSFSSRRDSALASEADGRFPLGQLTAQENRGHGLFYNRANCIACHLSGNTLGTTPEERYTDDQYHNIGVPANPELPGNLAPDQGVAGHTGNTIADFGKQRTPTLRNVDKRGGRRFVKAYTHNGWFKSLESIVHFYNTADVNGATASSFGITRCPASVITERDALSQNCWPAPEISSTSAIGVEMGDLGLTLDDEAAIVAYLKTLTDRETPRAERFRPARRRR